MKRLLILTLFLGRYGLIWQAWRIDEDLWHYLALSLNDTAKVQEDYEKQQGV